MAKVKPQNIPKKEREQVIGEFVNVVSHLKSEQEVIDFFVGMMTASEALMFARRMQVARRLLEEYTYDDITREMHVGKSTIAEVDRWLFERDGAYRKILEKQIKRIKRQKKLKRHEGLDRYPGHRLLKTLLGITNDSL